GSNAIRTCEFVSSFLTTRDTNSAVPDNKKDAKMRKGILTLAVLTVVCIFADPAHGFGKRKRGGGGCDPCAMVAVAPVSNGCGGYGAVATGYQSGQPNGMMQSGYIPPSPMPNNFQATPVNEVTVRLTDDNAVPATV